MTDESTVARRLDVEDDTAPLDTSDSCGRLDLAPDRSAVQMIEVDAQTGSDHPRREPSRERDDCRLLHELEQLRGAQDVDVAGSLRSRRVLRCHGQACGASQPQFDPHVAHPSW